MVLRWAHAVALSAGCLLGRPVAAQEHAFEELSQRARIVVVDSEPCEVVPQDELRKLIALELAPRAVRSHQADTDPALPRAHVRCSDTEAHLTVADAGRGRRQELTLDLSQIPSTARARLLALTLSELVATVELESPARTRVDAPRTEQTTITPQPRVKRSRAWLGIGIAREGSPAMVMPSLQTGATTAISEWPLALQGELQLHGGERSVSAGDVVSWTVSGSAAIAGQLVPSWAELHAGLGLRLGYAHLRGEASTDAQAAGQTVSGLWWGPTAFVSAVFPVQSTWGARLGLDVSYVVRDVRGLDGTGGTSYSISGFLLQANVGISLKLSEKPRVIVSSPQEPAFRAVATD